MHLIGRDEAISHAEVVTWTLKNQRTSSFRVAMLCEDGAFKFNTMLDKKGESLLLFEEFPNKNHPEVGPIRFHCTRTTLDGQILTEGVIEVPDITDYYTCSPMMEDVLKEHNGQAVIWSWAKHHHDTDDISTLMLIYYNFQGDRLEIRKHTVTDFRSNLGFGLEFHQKDAAYFFEFEDGRPVNLTVIDLQQSTCSKAKMDFPADNPLLMEEIVSMDFRFGDEMFLIGMYPLGFFVWCFDANVRLFNENIAYKEERKSKMDRRLLLKRDGQKSSSDALVTRKLD